MVRPYEESEPKGRAGVRNLEPRIPFARMPNGADRIIWQVETSATNCWPPGGEKPWVDTGELKVVLIKAAILAHRVRCASYSILP